MSNKTTTDTVFSHCPIRNILAHICGKWSMLVLYTIGYGETMRFSTLHRRIPDISQKMLTSTLRSLEADGLVERHVYAEVPPRVEYALTARALSFLPVMENLIDWAKDNMAGIMHSRAEAGTTTQV